MADVDRLFIARARRQPMQEVSEARAVTDRGLEGYIHGRPGSSRQLLLIEREALERLGIEPGIVRENVTTRGIGIQKVEPGWQLRAGGATLEVTGPCEPCERMEEIRAGLREELKGQRGILCRVVAGGAIRRGDPIEVLVAEHASRGTEEGT